ncbi:MAG TPA: DNA polymerase ligase N-terminal domain-containing protein [Nitrosopumilaceae archaeon]|nr:DNA polymerase ligase N-terminal domain-containing protein [Nitrosopumilaceae archaeon]
MSREISKSFCEQITKKYDKKDLPRPVYVIQEHHAKRLHWDLRFEIDKVLKSWALPRIPPQKEGEKRLAVQVEDHPIEYALFEGEIPEGNYGAGIVKIWDKGTFEILEQDEKKFIVDIKGNKLRGKYCILHFKPVEKNWLFFKVKD